jgi:hypothetical protein
MRPLSSATSLARPWSSSYTMDFDVTVQEIASQLSIAAGKAA